MRDGGPATPAPAAAAGPPLSPEAEWPRGVASGLWLGVFCYTAIVAIVVQTVLIPLWLPRWHAGHGLLAGLDSVAYHALAAEQATAIRSRGWDAWVLRPHRHLTSGLASAVYAVIAPEPWALIPLNAALHATAAVALLAMLGPLAAAPRLAVYGVLPFVMFPSAITWYAQLNKDGLPILGALLFVAGWTSLARLGPARAPTWRATAAAASVPAGAFLAWAGRPYLAEVLLGAGGALALLLTGVGLARVTRGTIPWRHLAATLALVWAAALAVAPIPRPEGSPPPIGEVEAPEVARAREITRSIDAAWRPAAWLPSFVDGRARGVARSREVYRRIYPDAGTNVATDVRFTSAADVVAHLPRALQIGLLAPFPSHWVGQGVNPGGSAMRRIAGLEMVLVYLALSALPGVVWRWRRRAEVWVILVCCLGVVTMYGLVVTNAGAIHRLRYGFMMPLVGLSVVGGTSWWIGRRATAPPPGAARWPGRSGTR